MRLIIAIFLAFALLAQAPTVSAAGPSREQDRARETLKRQKVIPYGKLRRSIESRYNGKIIGQSLRERGGGVVVYDLKLKRDGGRIMSITVNARTGAVLSTRGK